MRVCVYLCVCVCEGGVVGKEGWKLDERGRQITPTLFFPFSISLFYHAVAHLRA